ncbi:MAG: hypothetical protein ACXWUC_10255 [Methylosarcina sp.]
MRLHTVETDQHIALMHKLGVIDPHIHHSAAGLCFERRQVAGHIGVVGHHKMAGITSPVDQNNQPCHQSRESHQKQAVIPALAAFLKAEAGFSLGEMNEFSLRISHVLPCRTISGSLF